MRQRREERQGGTRHSLNRAQLSYGRESAPAGKENSNLGDYGRVKRGRRECKRVERSNVSGHRRFFSRDCAAPVEREQAREKKRLRFHRRGAGKPAAAKANRKNASCLTVRLPSVACPVSPPQKEFSPGGAISLRVTPHPWQAVGRRVWRLPFRVGPFNLRPTLPPHDSGVRFSPVLVAHVRQKRRELCGSLIGKPALFQRH